MTEIEFKQYLREFRECRWTEDEMVQKAKQLSSASDGAKPVVKCSLPPDEIISLVDGLRAGVIAGADISEHLYEWNASVDAVVSKLQDAFNGNDI